MSIVHIDHIFYGLRQFTLSWLDMKEFRYEKVITEIKIYIHTKGWTEVFMA